MPDFERCPECGADNSRAAAKCWLCGAAFAGARTSQDRVAEGTVAGPISSSGARQSVVAADAPRQFQLSSLFLTITVICLCLGLFRVAPGLVVPLMVISVPALVRTRRAAHLASMAGKPLSPGARIGTFLTSIFILVLVIVAACVALCMACFGVILSGIGPQKDASLIQFLLIGGSVVVGFFVIWIFRATWPKAK
jgi:hypothetical protein